MNNKWTAPPSWRFLNFYGARPSFPLRIRIGTWTWIKAKVCQNWIQAISVRKLKQKENNHIHRNKDRRLHGCRVWSFAFLEWAVWGKDYEGKWEIAMINIRQTVHPLSKYACSWFERHFPPSRGFWIIFQIKIIKNILFLNFHDFFDSLCFC